MAQGRVAWVRDPDTNLPVELRAHSLTSTDSREGRPHTSVQQGAFAESYLGKELLLRGRGGVLAESYLGKELLLGETRAHGGICPSRQKHFGLVRVTWVRDPRQKPRSGTRSGRLGKGPRHKMPEELSVAATPFGASSQCTPLSQRTGRSAPWNSSPPRWEWRSSGPSFGSSRMPTAGSE